MIIYPAIDIRGGYCVRLSQGNYAKETIYGDSPLLMANNFIDKKADWLHVVDLDGAKEPNRNQASLIKVLLETLSISIQVGGGIRTEKQINAYFESGASRVVIGSLALQSPQTVISWLKNYGANRIVLALDVLFDGDRPFVMTEAWQRLSKRDLFEVIDQFLDHGVQDVLCTDISRDGVLNGPNFELYQRLRLQFPSLKIQASGGIRSHEDLQTLKRLGIAGAVVGRALYEKKFDLSEVLSC
jgi:phosphoribosylformimino-5-aminoimidazole carboxamide ribotide isomerase